MNYIRKCLLKKSGDDKFVNIFIKNISKFVRKDLFGQAGVAFVLELVNKAALEGPTAKIFDNLNRQIDMQQDEKNRAQIFISQLNCYKYRKDVAVWLAYLNYLWKNDKNSVKVEYQRALIALDSDSSKQSFSKAT